MKLSLKAYARHRGVKPPSVRKAINAGRLTEESCTRKGRKWEIDVERADAEWDAQTNVAQQRTADQHRRRQSGLWGELEGSSGGNGNQDPTKPTLLKAQMLRMTFQAQLTRLEFEEKSGTLVRKDLVDAEAFSLARLLRDRLLQIPDRIADELAAEADASTIHRRLVEEITDSLLDLSGGEQHG
jgi:hypothetical protein